MYFTQMDSLKNQLSEKRPFNETELRRLREEFIIENTYNSNAIEGNSLTLRETALILKEGLTIAEKPMREHLEVIGHKEAFDYILTLTDANTAFTERTILDIHSLILMNDQLNKGIYRRIDVAISGAVHTPPEPHLVTEQMEQLLVDYEQMKQEKHIIEAISEFHLRFEGIHPFIDGNGRTGRLVLNLELMKAGYLPVNIKYSDRRKYYECFDAYYGNDNTPKNLIELITNYEIMEIEKMLKIIGQIEKHCNKKC